MAYLLFILAGIVFLVSIIFYWRENKRHSANHPELPVLSTEYENNATSQKGTTPVIRKKESADKTGTSDNRPDVDNFITDFLQRTFNTRRGYYREVYLKSAAWERKRYVVLKRDKWTCVRCGKRATQVHHKRYARKIGKEPIYWLISVCQSCHDDLHT